MTSNIEKKLNKYRQKLINSTDPEKIEIYNLKMQQYLIMQKSNKTTAPIHGSETSAYYEISHIGPNEKQKVSNNIEPMKNFLVNYYTEELNKLNKKDAEKLREIKEELKLLEPETLNEIKQKLTNPIISKMTLDLIDTIQESSDESSNKEKQEGFRKRYIYKRY